MPNSHRRRDADRVAGTDQLNKATGVPSDGGVFGVKKQPVESEAAEKFHDRRVTRCDDGTRENLAATH